MKSIFENMKSSIRLLKGSLIEGTKEDNEDFNEVVALDLRINSRNKKHILYAIDTYSRLTRGLFIKNKEPSTIVKGILEI